MIFRAVLVQSLWWDTLRPTRSFLSSRQVLPWGFYQVCGIVVLVLADKGPVFMDCYFAGPVDAVPCFSGAGDVSTEVEVRHDRRRKRAVITSRSVPLLGHESGPDGFGSRDRSQEVFVQALDVGYD